MTGSAATNCTTLVKPTSQSVKRQTFVNFGEDTYAYSAYFDNRTKEVRVFGMIRTNYSGLNGILCVLWYNDSAEPKVIQAQVMEWDRKKR